MYTCGDFLQDECVSSNVGNKHCDGKTFSYNVYNCRAFLQCEFSYALYNLTFHGMFANNVYNCGAFSHCESLSDAYSFQSKKNLSYTIYRYMAFL